MAGRWRFPGEAGGVVELLELVQGVEQVPLVPDQSAVEQFAAAGLHSSLHERVHSRHLDPAEHDLDPGVLEHGVEQAGELAVTVPDQEPRPVADVLEVYDEVLRGLGYPGGSGLRSGAQDPDPPGGVLDHSQHSVESECPGPADVCCRRQSAVS